MVAVAAARTVAPTVGGAFQALVLLLAARAAKARPLGAAEDVTRELERILDGDYQVSRRMRIDAKLVRDNRAIECHTALNDVAIVAAGDLARMLNLTASIDGEHLTTYSADGLIVATPTGSTAYSLAAGGPIVNPEMEAMILTPISPHTLSNRPLVVSSEQKIQIDIGESNSPIIATIDGQIGLEMEKGDHVEISRAKKSLELIAPAGKSFFSILRSKLSWSGSPGKRDQQQ